MDHVVPSQTCRKVAAGSIGSGHLQFLQADGSLSLGDEVHPSQTECTPALRKICYMQHMASCWSKSARRHAAQPWFCRTLHTSHHGYMHVKKWLLMLYVYTWVIYSLLFLLNHVSLFVQPSLHMCMQVSSFLHTCLATPTCAYIRIHVHMHARFCLLVCALVHASVHLWYGLIMPICTLGPVCVCACGSS